jgi:hypothetical protein
MGEAVENVVIAGLDPAIHRAKRIFEVLMDARVILREDGASRLLPAHDDSNAGL